MNQRSKAEEDLRVIRGLMERATIYRAISAPSALVAGGLSILVAGAIYFNNEVDPIFSRVIRGREFAYTWIAVLIAASVANTFLVWREARQTGRPFISSGMKLALRTIAPCLLLPAAFTVWFLSTGYQGGTELDLIVAWIAFYGLALLSTALFAPRSLVILGWAFLLTGLSVPVLLNLSANPSFDMPPVVMGITFGLYHLIYAVCTWPRKRDATDAQLVAE
jgi:hypothetical protein